MAGRPRKVYPGELDDQENETEEIIETYETEKKAEKQMTLSEYDAYTLELLGELIDNLAKTESARRAASKPHRYAFFTRRQLERISMNFKKSTR